MVTLRLSTTVPWLAPIATAPKEPISAPLIGGKLPIAPTVLAHLLYGDDNTQNQEADDAGRLRNRFRTLATE